MSLYTRYFGLHENPFALPPDPRYLYMGRRYQEALAHLLYGITQGGGFVQLTGEVGTGKTMMIRALLERLPPEVNVALVLYPLLSVEEFVLAICDDLQLARPDNSKSLKCAIDTLNRYLLDNHARGRRTVLIIDEAHKLSHDVLEQVRLLTNLETTKEKLLQILLVGQPELSSLLAQPDLRQLAQRVTARYDLTPLRPSETAEYVVRRLDVAGAKNPIFTRGALRVVHRLAGGIPRLVNTFCDRALLGAYAHGKNRISAAMLRRAAAEVGHAPARWYLGRAALAAGVATILAVGAWQLALRLPSPLPVSGDVAIASPVPEPDSDEVETAIENVVSLEDALAAPQARTDTDSALAALFAEWRKDYTGLTGATGCERAEQAGLRCIYATGTWNNLRQLNRPALVELRTPDDQRHQVLVKGLRDNDVALAIGDEVREFPLTDVERFWYGKFLTLWKPPATGEMTLRLGMEGPAVAWLRRVLARHGSHPPEGVDNTTFDATLRAHVQEFQRQSQLEPDGVVGRNTLIQLDAYDADLPPAPLLQTATAPAGVR